MFLSTSSFTRHFIYFTEQLRGFSVYLTSEEMSNTIKLKPDYNDTNFDAAVYVLNITKRARYCKLIIPPVYKNTVRPIVLCEVEIWGKRT